MAKAKVSSPSKSRTYAEMAEFWDTHSLSDYDDRTHEVEMIFDPSARRIYVGIESELMEELRRIARQRRVSIETLVNLWLRQRVDKLKAA